MAQVACFQELLYGPYACEVQDARFYEYAESVHRYLPSSLRGRADLRGPGLPGIDVSHSEETAVARSPASSTSLSTARTVKTGHSKHAMTETGHQFADQHTLPEKGPVLTAYRELHVEQGPLLERQDVPIGVVTGIVGIEHGTMHFTGRANHAGTTPMGMGQDAALGVARGVVEARRLVIEHELRATVSHSFRVARRIGRHILAVDHSA